MLLWFILSYGDRQTQYCRDRLRGESLTVLLQNLVHFTYPFYYPAIKLSSNQILRPIVSSNDFLHSNPNPISNYKAGASTINLIHDSSSRARFFFQWLNRHQTSQKGPDPPKPKTDSGDANSVLKGGDSDRTNFLPDQKERIAFFFFFFFAAPPLDSLPAKPKKKKVRKRDNQRHLRLFYLLQNISLLQ